MRLSGVVVIVLALLLLPSAGAGSERNPEVSSPRDKSNASGDLLAVWYDHDPRGLSITFKAARLAARENSLVYYTSFELRGQTVSPGVGFDSQGRLRTDSGANPGGWGNGRLDDRPIVDNIERGEPGYITIIIPWGLYGLREGDVVKPIMAASSLCCDRNNGGGWYAPYDTAPARASQFTVESASFLPIMVPAWVIPTIVLTCTVGGIGGGFALARVMRRKSAAAPVATQISVSRYTPPPPGKRFARAPPKLGQK